MGDVLYSDIVGFINGFAIPTYISNGKVMIIAEDLRNYGFDVIWDAGAWALYISRNNDKSYTPLPITRNTMPSGTFKMHFVYTNIRAFLEGSEINIFAIDG
jgi:hypothetical protein